MNWKKRGITIRTLEIVRKDRDGKISKWYADYGDSLTPKEDREITISHKDREIHITPHEIEHYTLTLKHECPKGTLGIIRDELGIGITDGVEIGYIHRGVSDSATCDKNPEKDINDTFCFERNRLTSYNGRPRYDYHFEKDADGKRRSIKIPLPGFTNDILDDRQFVLDPCLNPHYESFKQLRPDVAKSLEACLKELRKE